MEKEVKVRLEESSLMKLRKYLNDICIFKGTISVVDVYLNHPCRNFAETDEAVRIRLLDEPVRTVEITYKGPKKFEGLAKVREEITISIDGKLFEEALKFFSKNGFNEVATIKKKREIYDCPGYIASIDLVENLGEYAEFEAKEGCLNCLDSLVEMLGFTNKIEKKTYLELYLEKLTSFTP